MIRIILIISFFFFGHCLFSQVLNVGELLSLAKLNLDEVDTYIINKGFRYSADNNSESASTQEDCKYYSSYMHNSGDYSFAIYSCVFDNYMVSVAYRMYDEKEYLEVKKQLKNNGFVFVDSFNYQGAIIFQYAKSEGEINIDANIVSREISGISVYELTITQ